VTLQVPFEQFVPTVRRLLSNAPAFVRDHGSGSLVTAADPAKRCIVACAHTDSASKTIDLLRAAGLEASHGQWREEGDIDDLHGGESVPYVAAISYRTEGDSPGIWVDAFQELPTQVMALRSLYDEFRSTGELSDDISFEEFVRLACPNVVIASPEDLASYVRQKEGC
jgi:hypothetical protein